MKRLGTIFSNDGEHQVILPELRCEIAYTEQRDTEIDSWQREGSSVKLDLSHGPLFLLRALQQSGDVTMLQLTVHHIIVDGWSLGMIMDELSSFYNGFISGTVVKLPGAVPFRNYAAAIDILQNDPTTEVDRNYWGKKMMGNTAPAATTNRFIHIRVRRVTRLAAAHTNLLCHSTNNLNRFQKRIVAPHLSSYQLPTQPFLHRYTGTENLVFGIPVGGRHSEADKQVIGYCANLLPVVTTHNNNDTFLEVLARTKKELMDCFEHQAYPFANILYDLKQKRP